MSTPEADAFHRIARTTLGPRLASLGLRQPRSGAAWASVRANETQKRLRLQLSKWNRQDAPDGCEFTVELELIRDEPIAYGRLFELLTEAGREEHRQLQNLVIAKLPLDEDGLDRLPPAWQADRLARVAPRLVPYAPHVDVWFKYVDDGDVRRWMSFIGDAVPGAFDRLENGLK